MDNKSDKLPRKELIIKAAAKLFRTKGYEGTSVRDIAAEAGILKGSVYHYIETKEDLLFEIMMRGISLSMYELEKIMAQDTEPAEKLKGAVYSLLWHVMNYTDESAVWLYEKESLSPDNLKQYMQYRDKYEKTIRAVIEEGMNKGQFKQFNPKLVTFGILGMCNWLVNWYKPEGALSSNQIIEEYVMIIEEMLVKK